MLNSSQSVPSNKWVILCATVPVPVCACASACALRGCVGVCAYVLTVDQQLINA